MNVNVIKDESYIVFQIIGSFDQQGAMFLRDKLINDFGIAEEVPVSMPQVIFDFSQIESVSSSGIGLLASLQRTFNRSSKHLALVKIPNSLQQILRVANLTGVFSIYKSLDEAVKSQAGK